MKSSGFICLFLLLCALYPAEAMSDEITIVADVWCPYNCEPGSSAPGYMIEIARQTLKKKGHSVVYKTMEWQKAVEETRRGRYTAVVGALKNDAPGFVFPPNAQGAAQSVFFVKKGASWKYAGVDSLKKVKVGVIEGYSYNDEVDAYIAAHKGKPGVLVATGDAPLQVLIEHLMKGDIDTFIEDPSVFANYCGTKKLFNVLDIIKDAGACGPKEKIYIAFSPANPKSKDYAAALSAGLGEMRKSGELKKLLAKYYLKDWE